MSLQLTGSKEQGVCLPRKIDPKKCYKEDLVHTVHLIDMCLSPVCSHALFTPYFSQLNEPVSTPRMARRDWNGFSFFFFPRCSSSPIFLPSLRSMLRLVSSQLERGHHTDDKTLAEAAVSFLARSLPLSLRIILSSMTWKRHEMKCESLVFRFLGNIPRPKAETISRNREEAQMGWVGLAWITSQSISWGN